LSVRPLTPADSAAVAAIDADDPSPWSAAQIRAELENPANICLGSRDAAEGLAGFIIARTAADEGEIIRFAVRKKLRRQGNGQALLHAALQAAASRGAARVFLEVRAGNRAAMDLYKKNGFTVNGRRRNYYNNPREDAVCMAVDTNPAGKDRRKPEMKNIREIDIKGKKILIRVDFNVPMDEMGNITDDTRIRGVLPTINHALDEGAKIIICSHMGRPKGKRDEKYSLAPVAKRLSRLIDKEVLLAPDCVGPEVEKITAAMADGDVVLLENLRFHPEEQANDPEFAKKLAILADIYINDAFAVAHRAHASVVGVVEHVETCAAGFLLQKEMDYFHRSVSDPRRPLVAIIGGAKVSSKLGALRNLLDRVDKMIIGGAMANTFLRAMGYSVGKSRVEEDLIDTAAELMEKAKSKGVKLYLPVDCIVAERFDPNSETMRTTVQEVPEYWMILDIGPATTTLFSEALENARTIIWNGPMGAFEMDAFSRGTMAMVQRVASSHALTIVGGGDTDVAVHRAGESNNISYISTGGGAFLMLMEGKKLPGVEALERC